jgi:hypothetical protein
MKHEVIVSFDLEDVDLGLLEGAWSSLLPERELVAGLHEIRFARGDSAITDLTRLLDVLALPYRMSEERSFSEREIANAPALYIAPGTTAGGPGSIGAYSFDAACPVCERGREQVADLVIDDPAPDPHGLGITPAGQLLAEELLARAMVGQRITGCLLRGTRDPGGEARDLFQVQPVHTLPPTQSPPTRFTFDPEARCPLCRGGGLAAATLLFYNLSLEDLADVNLCREELGSGAGLVVTQRFFRLLLECGVEPAAVEPVMLL